MGNAPKDIAKREGRMRRTHALDTLPVRKLSRIAFS
jgi:hypothetical protein